MQIEEILIIRHDDIRYGIRTDDIEQILRVPDITPLALSPDEVQGLCAVGGNITTVMDINMLLGLEPVDGSQPNSRLLTLSGTHTHIGLLVSMVVDTVDIDSELIETISEPDDAVVAIYNDKDQIVQILDLGRLFDGVGMRTFGAKEVKDGTTKGVDESAVQSGSNERFLLFRMANERYAVQIDSLREIIGLHSEMTEIANSKAEIRGMISLREELLVVADLRTYYGFDAVDSDKNRILVMHNSDGKKIGLVIDEII
ncbi:MAG: chemotaxis protein CheW, partial [Sulfurimonadaceae bacterium]|nr:chemotaxis protein CheW [Sulfurimonadaceae bacterium]